METHISCLCGCASQTVTLNNPPTDSRILKFCRCGACRRTSGLLCASYIPLKSDTKPDLENLTAYPHNGSIRWFCGTCGAHVFIQLKEVPDNDRYLVASGLLNESLGLVADSMSKGLWNHDSITNSSCVFIHPEAHPSTTTTTSTIKTTSHRYIKECSTVPPGDGNREPRQTKEIPSTEPNEPNLSNANDTKKRQLLAECHCGGVRYVITPPDSKSGQISSSPQWPDLLRPYHLQSADNPEDVKWWLRKDGTRFLAGLCACNSCRLASGFPVQTWAFVPRTNISFKTYDIDNDIDDGGSGSRAPFIDYYDDLETIQGFESSPAVYREFCKVCGATVFWHCAARPDVVDVSMGLFRTEGVRAEEWLDWETGRISFAEEAPDQLLMQSLIRELLTWGVGQKSSAMVEV